VFYRVQRFLERKVVVIETCEICGKRYILEPSKPSLPDYYEKVPFFCKGCGNIRFDMRAIQGKVILYPFPPEKTYEGTSIEVPIQYQEFYKAWKGFVLSVGSGYYEQSGQFIPTTLEEGSLVLFNRDVPWYGTRKGLDGKEHPIVLCGERDVWIVLSDNVV